MDQITHDVRRDNWLGIIQQCQSRPERPYYYFKYLLTKLPKQCDKQGNIDPAKLDYLIPWSDSLPDECRKPRH